MNRKLLRGLGVGLAVAALVYLGVAAYADWGKLQAALRAFHWQLFAPVLGLSLLNYAIRFCRWQLYLRQRRIELAAPLSLRIFLAGLALSVFAIKPPLLLAPLLYLAVTGRRRATWTTILATGVQAVASMALVGPKGVREFVELSRRLSGPDGTIVTNVWGMVNIRSVVVRAFPVDDRLLTNVMIVLLTAVTLFLCLAQLGPLLVLIPAVAWLFWTGQTIAGTVLAVIAVASGTLDNIVRPLLIRRGADLPLILIFAGVLGGLVAFGVVGLFVGPVVLAVAYTLLNRWIDNSRQTA